MLTHVGSEVSLAEQKAYKSDPCLHRTHSPKSIPKTLTTALYGSPKDVLPWKDEETPPTKERPKSLLSEDEEDEDDELAEDGESTDAQRETIALRRFKVVSMSSSAESRQKLFSVK